MGLKKKKEPVQITTPFWEWWNHTPWPSIFWGIVAFLVCFGLVWLGVQMMLS